MSASPVAQRDTSVDPRALQVADAFYNLFKAACHGISRRIELWRLFESTFPSFQSPREGLDRPWNNYERFDDEMGTPHFFNKVLYALARGLNVVRVVDGGQKLLWAANRPAPRRAGGYQSRRPAPRRDGGYQPRSNRPAPRREDDRLPRMDARDQQIADLKNAMERQQALLDTLVQKVAGDQ